MKHSGFFLEFLYVRDEELNRSLAGRQTGEKELRRLMYFLLKHLIQLTSCLCSFSKTKIWQLLPAPLFKLKEASVGRARFPLFVWIIHCPAKGPTSQIQGRKETYLSSNIKKTKPKKKPT